jgi:hypothetical protein
MATPSLYHCPQCGGSFLVITEEKIYCMECRLTFNRSILDKICEENIHAEEELKNISEVFTSMIGMKPKNQG